jgi:hypothetical protein
MGILAQNAGVARIGSVQNPPDSLMGKKGIISGFSAAAEGFAWMPARPP